MSLRASAGAVSPEPGIAAQHQLPAHAPLPAAVRTREPAVVALEAQNAAALVDVRHQRASGARQTQRVAQRVQVAAVGIIERADVAFAGDC